MRTEELRQHAAGNGTSPSVPRGPAEQPALPVRRWSRLLSLPAAVIAVTLLVFGVFVGPKVRSWLAAPPPAGLLFASGRIEGRITTLTPKTSAWVVTLHIEFVADEPRRTLVLALGLERLRPSSLQAGVSLATRRARLLDLQRYLPVRHGEMGVGRAQPLGERVELLLGRPQPRAGPGRPASPGPGRHPPPGPRHPVRRSPVRFASWVM